MTTIQSHPAHGAEMLLDGLHASAPEPLPFAPGVEIRSFLLAREQGNIGIYSVTGLDEEAPEIRAAGGVARRYLNHRHEAMFAPRRASAPLFVHEADARSVAKVMHVRGTFSRRHVLDDDFEVIPIPGHTPGATAYLWDDGHRRMLFTGDTITLGDGEWIAAVLDSSDRRAYLASLELMRDLDFDVLVPWAATAGAPPFALTDAADARRRIDAIIARVRRGEAK